MQMPMRVTGTRRVVPNHRRLDPLHRHLYLTSPRPYPGGRVLREPGDDLGGRLALGFVQRGRDLRVQGRDQRPGLRAVDGDLDEPQRVRVIPDPTLLVTGVDVDTGDPLLIGLAVHRSGVLDTVRGRGEPGRHSAALAEVVVIGP